MAKYVVEVMRTTWSYATVEVEAESESDAENRAQDLAFDGELDFEIDDSSLETSAVYLSSESDQ
jgi:hypothetical protein